MGKRKRRSGLLSAQKPTEEPGEGVLAPSHSEPEQSEMPDDETTRAIPEERTNHLTESEANLHKGTECEIAITDPVDQQHTTALDEQDASANDEQEDPEDENDELETMSRSEGETTAKAGKVIDLNEMKKFGKRVDKTGLIYISRIPPGMGPSKLKHLLAKWGQVGRIYLARDQKAEESKKHKKGGRRKAVEKHQSFLFKEGWVEFLDKKVARRVAEMLNARPIGGKPSERYYSDLWSLTYLPKFRWTNLSDQMAVERRIHEEMVRNSLQESKTSQDWYLDMVEKNATNQKILKKQKSKTARILAASASNAPDGANDGRKIGKHFEFKQRKLPSGTPTTTTPTTANLNDQNSKLNSVLNGLL